MSYITEVVVLGAYPRTIERLNNWLKHHDGRQQQLRKIDMDAAGGTKFFVGSVWAAAFNYVPHEFVEYLKTPEAWQQYGIQFTVDTEGQLMTVGMVGPPDADRKDRCAVHVIQYEERMGYGREHEEFSYSRSDRPALDTV